MDYSNIIPNAPSAGGLAAFDRAEAAPELAPLPPGIYTARVVRGEYCTTKAGADAYRIRFEVTDGDHRGRTVVRTWTFTPRALPYTKRDLAPLGLTTSAQLLAPFPPPGRDILCRLTVALQRGDDGVERNDIKRIEVLRVDASPLADYLLPSDPAKGGAV